MSSGCPVKRNLDQLSNPKPEARRKAVEILGKSLNKAAIKPLIELLEKETDLKVRRAIILSLSLLGGESVLPILLQILQNDSDLDTRRNAAGGLRFFGDKIKGKELLDLVVKETDESIRDVLVGTIIYLRDETLIPQLLSLFDIEKDDDIKGCILEIIGSFSNPQTKELLISCSAADSPKKLRLIATQAMGKLDDINLIPTIYEVYKNDNSKKIVDVAGKILDEFTILLGFSTIDQMVLDIIDSQQ